MYPAAKEPFSRSRVHPRLLNLGAALAVVSLANRVASYLREAVMAHLLGASVAADQYAVAYMTSNSVGIMLGTAFGVVLVPQLVARELAGDRDGVRTVIGRMSGALLLLSLLLAAGMSLPLAEPQAWTVLGAAGRWNWWAFAAGLPLSGLFTLYGYVLNARERFLLPMALPILLDAIVVAGATLGLGQMGLPAIGFAYLLGSVAILGVVAVRAAQTGPLALPQPVGWRQAPWWLVLPALLATGTHMLLPILARAMAVPLEPGDAAVLHYAGLVANVPVTLIAAPAATILLPYLSRAAAARGESFGQQSSAGLTAVLVLAIPAAVGVSMLAQPIAALLFGRGAFDADAVARLGWALAVEAPGLIGLAAMAVIQQGWYARGDTATPLKLSLLGLAAGGLTGFALRGSLGYLGLALGVTLGHLVTGGSLAAMLHARTGQLLDRGALGWLARSVVAAAGMGAVLWAWLRLMSGQHVAVVVLGGILVGAAAYGLVLGGWYLVSRRGPAGAPGPRG